MILSFLPIDRLRWSSERIIILKHRGRMQLGLFLKGVGLQLDDALAFWKAEFSQKIGAEKFDKEYMHTVYATTMEKKEREQTFPQLKDLLVQLQNGTVCAAMLQVSIGGG